jgi:hypothetical protein
MLNMTTRDEALVEGIGARVQRIPAMSESEALTLLEEWAEGNLADADRSQKAEIVKELGYLPLAVKLAGAQLRRQTPNKWLKDFKTDVRILRDRRPDPNNPHDSLEKTLRLSLDELDTQIRSLYAALAIFKEDEAIHESGIARLWEGLAGVSRDEAREVLDDLHARALLVLDRGESLADDNREAIRTVIIHDLLRDFMAIELRDHRIAHRALLDAYRATCKGNGWHTAPDDGYLYDHLAYHLDAVGAAGELKALFANQSWLHARVSRSGYHYDGYLGDLLRAWEYPKKEVEAQIKRGDAPGALAECVRYALIYTSSNSIAGNYEPALVAQAVTNGVWSPERAISVAAKIPDAVQRAEMYRAMLGTNRLSAAQRSVVLAAALEAVLAFEDVRYRVEVLTALMPQLPETQRARVLTDALEAALAIGDEGSRAMALTALAPQLFADLLTAALEAVLAIEDEWRRAEVLTALAPQLSAGLLAAALEAALAFEDGRSRGEVLTALAPQLPETQRASVLAAAFEEALVIGDARFRAEAITALAPQLPEVLLATALKAALAFEDEWWRAEVLTALAPPPRSRRRLRLRKCVSAPRCSPPWHPGCPRRSAQASLPPRSKRRWR